MHRPMSSFPMALLLFAAVQTVHCQGLFNVVCAPLTIQRSDPIVNPGVASGHVHSVVGGTAFNRTETNAQAVNAVATTCNKKTDNSNYWVPQLYHINGDGTFGIVPFQSSLVYYFNRACDYNQANYAAGRLSCDSKFNATAPPAGFRVLAGNPALRTYNASSPAQNAINYACIPVAGQGNIIETNGFPTTHCNQLRAQVYFPACWDGLHLDSADHTSHVAYPLNGYQSGMCPSSHPVAFVSPFYEFFFNTANLTDTNLVWSMGDPTGYGLHGDFINGWNQTALGLATATCQGSGGASASSCSVNYNLGSSGSQNLQVPAPTEDVGLTAPLKALPGNNPVTH